MVGRMPWDQLIPHLGAASGIDSTGQALAKLRVFAERLIEWNHRVSNLISPNDEQRLVERHILESLEPAPLLRESGVQSLIDFGSGAGFPALPLAIAGVGEQWTLVESRRPKTLFLQKMIADLELPNVRVIHARLEVIAAGQDRPQVDALTSRATMRAGPTLEIAKAIVREGGYAFLWKGSGVQDELSSSQVWKQDWTLENSASLRGGPVSILTLRRINPTQLSEP